MLMVRPQMEVLVCKTSYRVCKFHNELIINQHIDVFKCSFIYHSFFPSFLLLVVFYHSSVNFQHSCLPLVSPYTSVCSSLQQWAQLLGETEADVSMAHFDTEYQRLEASYSDSPPGEENLLMHVPEGAKCTTCIYKSQTHIRTRLFYTDSDDYCNNTITDLH